jgi:nucleotide-binding universal stress UspA family protein
MEVFSHTLVAVEGSIASAIAVDLALQLARPTRFHAVRFVSVIDREPLLSLCSLDAPGTFAVEHALAAAQAEGRRSLDEAIDRACRAGVEATCTLREGRPADGILAEALASEATCIIVGAAGRGTDRRAVERTGERRAVLGSCVQGVLRRSRVPVLIAYAPMLDDRTSSSGAFDAPSDANGGDGGVRTGLDEGRERSA